MARPPRNQVYLSTTRFHRRSLSSTKMTSSTSFPGGKQPPAAVGHVHQPRRPSKETALRHQSLPLHDIEACSQQPPPQQGSWRPCRFYPRLTHSQDTLTVNNFLDRTADVNIAMKRVISSASSNSSAHSEENNKIS